MHFLVQNEAERKLQKCVNLKCNGILIVRAKIFLWCITKIEKTNDCVTEIGFHNPNQSGLNKLL